MSDSDQPSKISRRVLIAGGFIASTAAVLSRAFYTSKYPIVLKALSAREAKTLEKIALAYFPKDNAIGVDGTQAQVVAYIDRYVHALGPIESKMIRAMLLAFDQGTLLSFKWTPLHRMDLAETKEYLAGWETSKIQIRRDIATGLKSLLGFAYFSHPEVLKNLGIQRFCASQGPSFVMESNA